MELGKALKKIYSFFASNLHNLIKTKNKRELVDISFSSLKLLLEANLDSNFLPPEDPP